MRFDNTQAHSEGWEISRWTNRLQVYRPLGDYALAIDDPPVSDPEALRYVQRRANEGSAYHIEALAYVAFTEPTLPTNYQGDRRWINNSNYIQTS